MKTSIAIFDSHQHAVESLIKLKEHQFPMKHVSLVGKAEITEDKIHVRSNNALMAAPVVGGTVVGTTLGLLSGISLFAVPGFGFLLGAGAIVGALAGFNIGLVTGGIGSLMMQMGIDKDYAVKYHEMIEDGKFLLFIDGTQEQVEQARKIIGEQHSGYAIHKAMQAPVADIEAA
jgi:uncharacterized membrane protein